MGASGGASAGSKRGQKEGGTAARGRRLVERGGSPSSPHRHRGARGKRGSQSPQRTGNATSKRKSRKPATSPENLFAGRGGQELRRVHHHLTQTLHQAFRDREKKRGGVKRRDSQAAGMASNAASLGGGDMGCGTNVGGGGSLNSAWGEDRVDKLTAMLKMVNSAILRRRAPEREEEEVGEEGEAGERGSAQSVPPLGSGDAGGDGENGSGNQALRPVTSTGVYGEVRPVSSGYSAVGEVWKRPLSLSLHDSPALRRPGRGSGKRGGAGGRGSCGSSLNRRRGGGGKGRAESSGGAVEDIGTGSPLPYGQPSPRATAPPASVTMMSHRPTPGAAHNKGWATPTDEAEVAVVEGPRIFLGKGVGYERVGNRTKNQGVR